MASGLDIFDDTIGKTQELLKDIETEMGWTDRRGQTYSLLRAVLHTLRSQLTVEETLHFSSQLPLLLKGILIDGWNPGKAQKRSNSIEFFEEFREKFPFSMDKTLQEANRIVMRNLGKFISSGEEEDIYNILPKDIVRIFA